MRRVRHVVRTRSIVGVLGNGGTASSRWDGTAYWPVGSSCRYAAKRRSENAATPTHPTYARPMDPADAAELARRVRAAVVEEVPRRRWVLPAVVLLVAAIVVSVVVLARG